jgi:hypothetical protein
MQLYTCIKEFYLGNLYYEDSFDFTRIEVGEVIGVLSGSPSTYVKGLVVPGLPVPGAYQYLTPGAIVPDPAVGGAVPTAPVAPPAANNSSGTQGTWSFDGTYYYWCVSSGNWVRFVPITVFP